MVTSLNHIMLHLPPGVEDDGGRDAEMEGIVDGAKVELPIGSTYAVTFVDCGRLEKEIELAHEVGRPYFGRPGLIVVSRATPWICTLAAHWAGNQDYFAHLNPTPYPVVPLAIASIKYGKDDECQALAEARNRGYLENVDVEAENGKHFNVTLMLPMRLSREIELDCVNGRPFFVEPGLIVMREISDELVHLAVQGLSGQGYFEHLKPVHG